MPASRTAGTSGVDWRRPTWRGSGRFRRVPVVAVAVALLLAACGHRVDSLVSDPAQLAEMARRKPGERRLNTAAEVAAELGCRPDSSPTARFDRAEVLPVHAVRGREMNQRLVYSACSVRPQALTGTLTRRIKYGRRVVYEESRRVVLKPGRWSVDVFLGIPASTEPGWYGLETTFENSAFSLYDWRDFAVINGPAP